jgi:hypothetical protein
LGLHFKTDHIKNALTKTKNPPKKYKIDPTFFAPKNTTPPPPPPKIQKCPHGFSHKKIQKYLQIIQKRPQIIQKDLKNENKGQIVIFGGLFVIFGFFFVFF